MFNHRIEAEPNQFVEAGNLELPPIKLVVEVQQLNREVIQSFPDYLIENISDRLIKDAGMFDFKAMPLEISVDGKTTISERALWTLIVEEQTVASKIDELVTASIKVCGGELEFYSSLDTIGQEPLYAYIDRWFRRNVKQVTNLPASHVAIVDSFVAFLNACDLMHETHQDDYIKVVIDYIWSDPVLAAKLLSLRLTLGQYTDVAGAIKLNLLNNGWFKNVVDQYIAPDVIYQNHEYASAYRILNWCASIYGSDKKATTEVFNYCHSNRAFSDDESEFESEWGRFSREQKAQDAELANTRYAIHTGFHSFNPDTRKWDSVA